MKKGTGAVIALVIVALILSCIMTYNGLVGAREMWTDCWQTLIPSSKDGTI